MKTSSIFFMVVGLGLGSCAPPTAPQRPSWDQDVFPILQGSCNHCHGETVGRLPGVPPNNPLGRLDICDPEPVMKDAPILIGAVSEAGIFEAYVAKLMPGATRVLMPPPPAAPLSDYEKDVLVRWSKRVAAESSMKVAGVPHPACAKQARNREPEMRVIGEPEWDNGDLRLQLEVWDPDQDQVVGKVTVGAASEVIPASGRRELFVVGARQGDPITVILNDGYVSRTIDL